MSPSASALSRAPRPSRTDWVPLSRHVGLLRRYWRTIAACTEVGLLAGAAWLVLAGTSYVATASVLVEEVTVDSAAPVQALSLDTEIRILRSDAVAQEVRSAINDASPVRVVAERIEVTIPPNTRILRITFEADDPDSAREGATTAGRAYLAFRSTLADRARAEQLEQLGTRLEDLAVQRSAAEAASIRIDADAVERRVAGQRSAALGQQINQLDQRISGLRTEATVPGALVEEADEALAVRQVDPAVAFASSALLGVLGGVLLALMARTRRRVRDRVDLRHETQLPVLSEVGMRDRITSSAQDTAGAGGVRHLSNRILMSGLRPAAVLVVSVDSIQAATRMAVALASDLSRSSSRAGLVSLGAPGREVRASLLGTDGGPDLHSTLARGADLDDAILRHRRAGALAMLSLGESPDAGAWLEPAAINKVLARLRATFDITVLAGSLAEDDEMLAVCSHVDAVILVVSGDRPTTEVLQALQAVRSAGGQPSGFVIAHGSGGPALDERSEQR